ncbi:hypothetical protein TNCV_2249701 [Trichonephila clavipes]|nr:hypothetical protein TNCV_2249701 [Trichonephila clavipes]
MSGKRAAIRSVVRVTRRDSKQRGPSPTLMVLQITQQPMRTKTYGAYHSLGGLRPWGGCADVLVKLSVYKKLPMLSFQANLVVIYRPSGGIKG